MSYIVKSFNTSEERDAAYKELREKYYDVVRYSNPAWIDGAWRTEWIVSYPPPVIETEEQLAEVINGQGPQ
jgi:hypothetical protein